MASFKYSSLFNRGFYSAIISTNVTINLSSCQQDTRAKETKRAHRRIGLMICYSHFHCERPKITGNFAYLQVGARLEQSCTSPINVTTNPLEHFSGRKNSHQQQQQQQQQTQQATIVVQQPSVSVDHHTVSTVLLKNGGEFVSNVQQQEKLKQLKQKEENVKQLLDVANNLTLEEIHDFEMR